MISHLNVPASRSAGSTAESAHKQYVEYTNGNAEDKCLDSHLTPSELNGIFPFASVDTGTGSKLTDHKGKVSLYVILSA